MVLDERIKIYKSSIFRPQLSMEDVVNGQGELVDVYSSNESLSNDEVQFSEKALVFIEKPIVYPKMSYLYTTRLNTVKDKILERLVRDLMFLNPNLKDGGVDKMTSWIVSYFVACNDEKKKVISFEELLPIVSRLCGVYEGGDVNIIESDKVILYKKDTLLTSSDKRWHSNNFRNKHVSNMLGELIHQGAIMASENISYLRKISKTCVVAYTQSDKVNTVRVFNSHVKTKTILFLEDDNDTRYFTTDGTEEKYLLFKEIYDESNPLDYYTKELNISKRTAVYFKSLLEQNVGNRTEEYSEMYNQLN